MGARFHSRFQRPVRRSPEKQLPSWRRLKIAGAFALACVSPIACGGQATATAARDSGNTLTLEMHLVDTALVKRARTVLERYGSTFFADGVYVPDTAGPVRVLEI